MVRLTTDKTTLFISRRQLLKVGVAVAALSAADPALAKWHAEPRDSFIERLLRQMTLEEKAGQLSMYASPGTVANINPDSGPTPGQQTTIANIAAGRVGGYYNGRQVEAARALQKVAVEQSRLKIPLIFAGDIIHGMRTIFPVPLGEAASFDPDLCQRTARATAIEATALGFHWTFAPMVDVARDQRWGRVVEGAGEDPWLGSRLAEARVRGFQGKDLRVEDSLLACPKHFAAYGAVQGGMDYNTADIPETTLREVHLRPFRAAFEAGALSTMSSFNDIGGVPASANHHLLTDILRGEWGFRGLVVSDYESAKELIAHGYAADGPDAVVKALTAGCDMDLPGGFYNKYVPELVRSGRLPVKIVDEAVRRVLRVKKALGLFDNPYRSLDPGRSADVRRPEAVALAREAGRKSIVLLKNEGALLPLPKTGKSIALIGPFATGKSDLAGPWAVFPDVTKMVPVDDAFRTAMSAGATLTVVAGCKVDTPIDGGIDAAVAAASAADVVVLHIGESTLMSGEAQSRTEITIPPAQIALVDAVAATGKPLVILLKHGRALELPEAVRHAQAILCTWFLGSESGNAIADIVFGDHAPQGRLPVSFPQRSGQEPFYYNHRTTGRPQQRPEDKAFKARYREVSDEALYPFGHGLGYSTVDYGVTRVSAMEFSRGDRITVTATLTNRGNRAQHEVAQLYIHDTVASITQPVRALKGLRHIDLQPGESAVVEFIVSEEQLHFVQANSIDAAERGTFDVWIAPSSIAGVPAKAVFV